MSTKILMDTNFWNNIFRYWSTNNFCMEEKPLIFLSKIQLHIISTHPASLSYENHYIIWKILGYLHPIESKRRKCFITLIRKNTIELTFFYTFLVVLTNLKWTNIYLTINFLIYTLLPPSRSACCLGIGGISMDFERHGLHI